MNPVEKFEHNGFTVEIHYDDSPSNPREDMEPLGIFVGFTHRRYSIGDKQINPRDLSWECGCDNGEVEFPFLGEIVTRECSTCEGSGYLSIQTWDDMILYIREHYDVVGPVLPVSMIDHGNVHYSIGFNTDRWDGSNAGVIFATRTQLDKTHGEGHTPSDEDLTKWLTGEVDEYSKWANGEVYGYVIKDRNGDDVDSCWGYIGSEVAIEAAKEACPEPEDVPPVLHTLRFSDKTLDVIDKALGILHAMEAGWENKAKVSEAHEIFRGARAGNDPEGNQMHHQVHRLVAPEGHDNAGKAFSFSLTPADFKRYTEQGWTRA